jgi:hypothetical protein
MGGLSKKSFQIKNITEKDKLPALVLDAGNLLFKPQSQPTPQDKITASGIMAIYTAMAYDAVAVGPQDTVAGLDLLVEAQKTGFPWLSANILDAGKKPVFKPAKVINRSGLTIGIIGLSDPATRVSAQSTVADWREVLPVQLATLEKTCDLLVLLSTLPHQDNIEISKNYPQLDIILTADRQQGNTNPRVVNSSLVAQTSRQGKYLGVLTIDWNPDQPWAKDLQQENQLLQNRLDTFDRQILREERRKTGTSAPAADRLAKLRKEREDLLGQITALKAEMAAIAQDDGFSTFTHSFVALSRNLPEDPAIADQVNQIKAMIYHQGSQASLPGREQKSSAGSSTVQGAADGLAGAAACSQCHQAQTAFWKGTGHARAYHTLVREKQHFNLDCLPCHVTPGSSPGKESSEQRQGLLNLPQSLQTVGCESCHGAALAHAGTPDQVRPQRKAGQEICLTCHTRERSPGFDFNRHIARVSCPAD